MPDIPDDTTMATAYVPDELYESWCEAAEERGWSTSQYIIRMVEAGRKNISVNDSPSNSVGDLLREKATLKKQIDRQQDRIDDLERRLQRTSQSAVVQFIRENPGVSTPEIIQSVADGVPSRVASQLDVLEGDMIQQRDGGYYPREQDNQ